MVIIYDTVLLVDAALQGRSCKHSRVGYVCALQSSIVIVYKVVAQLPGTYFAINRRQLGKKAHLICPQCGTRIFFHSNSYCKQTTQQSNRRDPRLIYTVPVLF